MPVTFTEDDFQEAPAFTDADFEPPKPSVNLRLSPYEKADLAAGGHAVTPEGPMTDFVRAIAPPIVAAGQALQPGLDKAYYAATHPIEAIAEIPLDIGRMFGLQEPEHYAPLVSPEQVMNVIEQVPSMGAYHQETSDPNIRAIQEFAAENISGLTSPPAAAAMITGAGFPGIAARPVARAFQLEALANVPESVQQFTQAQTTPERLKAGLGIAAGVAIPALIERGLTKGMPNASRVQETAEFHDDVPLQPGQGQGQVPAGESGRGIQPSPEALAGQAQVSLSPEHAALLRQEGAEMDVPIGEAATPLPPGDFMTVDRANGRIVYDSAQLQRYLNRLPVEQRSRALAARLSEERIHLATEDAEAEDFHYTLSLPERLAYQRIYFGKGNWRGINPATGVKISPTNLGHEALRMRIQQSLGDVSETVEAVGREKWTVQSLLKFADVVRGIRERLPTGEKGTQSRAILDRVLERVADGRVVAAAKANTVQPAGRDKEPATIEDVEQMSGPEYFNVAQQWAREAGPGKGLTVQEMAEQAALADPDQAKWEAAYNRMLDEKKTLTDQIREQFKTDPDVMSKRGPEIMGMAQKASFFSEGLKIIKGQKPAESRPAAFNKGELNLSDKPELERPSATELGAVPFTARDLERAGYEHVQAESERALSELEAGKKITPPSFKDYQTKMQNKYGDLKPGQLFEGYQNALYNRLFNASGRTLEALAKSVGVKADRVADPVSRPKGLVLESQPENRAVAEQARAEVRGQSQRERFRNLVIGRIAEKLITEAAPEAKAPTRTSVSPEDVADLRTATKQPVFFDITRDDLDRPGVLAQRLVQDARRSNRDPVSLTKRVTLLVDKQTGKATLVSTYPHGRSGAMLVDPSVSTIRAHRSLTDILKRYRPVASLLLDEPVQNFRQPFDSLGDFEAKLGTDARRASQQTFEEPLREGEQPEPGSWEKGTPITDAEAGSILDHITTEVGRFDEVTDVKASLSALKEDTNPQVLSAYRKLADRLIQQNPDLSDEGLINQLAQNIYDNHATAPDYETFVKRTMAQGGATYREGAPAGPTPKASETAKELTMRARRAPTSVLPGNIPPEAAARLGSQPAPPVPEGTLEPAKSRSFPYGTLQTRPDLQPPREPAGRSANVPTVQGALHEGVPGEAKPPDTTPATDSPAAFDKAVQAAKDEIDRVGDAVRLLTTRAALVSDIAKTIDIVDNRKNNEATQAETNIRLASVEKPSGVARYTQPWQRGNREVLSAANAVVEAQFNVGKLADFQNDLATAKANAAQMAQSASWRERRLAKAYQRDIAASEAEVEYAQNHWNDPELKSTARRVKISLDQQYALEKAKGFDLNKEEGYVPHRLLGVWGGAETLFQLPRVLGTKYRAPRTFSTHYEALAAGPYMRVTHDVASLVGHRVRQGLGNIYRHEWKEGLKVVQLPGGVPLAIEPKYGTHGAVSPDPAYKVIDTGLGPLAVHEDVYKPLRGLLASSYFDNSPIAGGLLHLEQQLKHSLLIGDFFHFARMFYYGTSIIGKEALGAGKSGWSMLNIAERDIPEAVRKGVISQKDANWANEKILGLTRRQIVDMAYKQFGANLGKVSDALYKDLLTELTPTAGPIRRTVARVADPSVGRYNRFLFEQMTRGLMAESIVREFERQSKGRAYNPDALMRDIVRDINERFGNIGRQGFFKSKTAQDFMRLIGLAPQWVEGMARTEARTYGRLSGGSKLLGQRKNVTTLGTTGSAMGKALVFMFGLTQAVNYITRGKSTFQNEEDGHKLDAWIPSWGSNGEGFWFNPLSVFMELSHDLYRLGTAKLQQDKPVGDAVIDILANKASPISRALLVMGTGKNPRGEKITSTLGRFGTEPLKAMAPLPITFGKYAQAAGHAIVPGVVPPVPPGQMQRQAFGSAGLKIEPALSQPATIHRLADKFMRSEGLKRNSGWEQVQTDEPSYTKLRQAIRDGDNRRAKTVYDELTNNRTPQQIAKHMKQSSRAPFTGSGASEKAFIGSLDDKQLEAYSRAQEKMLDDYEAFSDWFGAQE